MTRLFAPVLVSFSLLSTPGLSNDITIHGFVTALTSPANFEIDDYKIAANNAAPFELEKQPDGASIPTFTPQDIRVGTELEVTGDYDERSHELKARSIKVFFFDTLIVKRTALLEKVPALTRSDPGWTGVIDADGQRIMVSPTTSVTVKLNHSESKIALQRGKSELPKFTPDSLNLDTFVHYEGNRQSDGSINASKVEFEQAEVEDSETRIRSRFAPAVIQPDYTHGQPGEIEMYRKIYKIVPSQEAQDYINKLGNSLVPAHQKELPDSDRLKIPFRFFLVENEGFNALTYPNGVVIVFSGVFDVFENEAELAFALSHEISHAVERHVWQQNQYFRNELLNLRARGVLVPDRLLLANLRISGFSSQYARTLENQADRVGLEWMLAAGYDIREAPQSWKAVAEKMRHPMNPFWSSAENYTGRRSYLMAELHNNYSHVDCSRLRKDSEEFHRVVEVVRKLADRQRLSSRPPLLPPQ
jgi:hypothetical protein